MNAKDLKFKAKNNNKAVKNNENYDLVSKFSEDYFKKIRNMFIVMITQFIKKQFFNQLMT